ncbi:hypothetical protein EJ03DRAFT_347122 [Teratosphaeria nubilosa]|uniref:4'-phosphopantetheinyl transferase domain-containing protein n=1 Tax=Teratosphaeria nubilosa TaxID=161662 RepID=A0A6G1LNN8_9PEZI|nr:hypothetical protein EJ03DRAFT_347122 [Teratosphaeria nubilosa]
MPPRPFPFQLGIGTDIIHVPRIKSLLLKNGHDKAPHTLTRYMNQFLTYREQTAFRSRFFPAQNESGALLIAGWMRDEVVVGKVVRYLAGRWAAKEAVIKACQREIGFKDIQILSRQPGKQGVSGAVYGLVLDSPASAFAARTPTNADDAATRASSNEEAGVIKGDSGHFTPGDEQDDDLRGQVVEVSISHDGDYATAVCIAPREPVVGDVGGEAGAREP